MLITTSKDKTFKAFKLNDKGIFEIFREVDTDHEKSICYASISPDDTLLALASFDGRITIWLINENGFD